MNCEQPFTRLLVTRSVNFGTRVWWLMDSSFFDPTPHVFQLQHSYSGLNNAEDWTDVGASATNAAILYDDTPREAGKVLLSHYRIKLATPAGQYVSSSASCKSGINNQQWLQSAEIIRKESLRMRRARNGLLIKRRRYGEKCTACTNTLTGEVQNSDCVRCYGTGFTGGYHPPFHCENFELENESITEQQIEPNGSTRNDTITARLIGVPFVQRLDVLVDANTDERWHIQDINIAAAVGALPLVLKVSLLPLPFSHIIYTIPIAPR